MRQRIKDCVFLDTKQVVNLVNEYKTGRFELGGQHGAAVQYYLRNFLYLPYAVVAEVFKRKPWHVKQTIERMTTVASETRVPVTMNPDYQRYIESFDDYCRSNYGLKNVELVALTDFLEVDYLLWQSQKITGRYEDNAMASDNQHDLWSEVLSELSMDATDEVIYKLCDRYTITSNA
jgi:hypothetical protein